MGGYGGWDGWVRVVCWKEWNAGFVLGLSEREGKGRGGKGRDE